MCSSNKVHAVAFLGPSLGRNTVSALFGIPCHGSLPKFAKVVSPPPAPSLRSAILTKEPELLSGAITPLLTLSPSALIVM